jgi:omega-amidase
MKEEVKVSVVQFASEWLQLEKNIQRMREFVEAEGKAGQELIVFPELANIGYIAPVAPGDSIGIEGMTFAQFATAYYHAAETIPGPTTEALSELTKRYGVYVVVGLAEKHPVVPGTLYNSGALIGPNGVIGVHHKMHLPLNEKLFFYGGNEAEVFPTELGKIGVEVCYDGRFPELSRLLALKGAEMICCVWCIPAALGAVVPTDDSLYHRAYVRAQENGLFFINANRSGKQGNARLVGHSAIAAPNGTLLAKSETDEEEVIRAVLKEEELIKYRTVLNIFRDRRPELYGGICAPLSEPYKAKSGQPLAPKEPSGRNKEG